MTKTSNTLNEKAVANILAKAGKRVFVHAALYHEEDKQTPQTVRIFLTTFCQEDDETPARLFQLEYEARYAPSGWGPRDHIHLVELGTAGDLDAQTAELDAQLSRFWQDKLVPATFDGTGEIDVTGEILELSRATSGIVEEVYSPHTGGPVGLQLHYARILGWLDLYDQSGEVNAWAAETFLKRLGGLLGNRYAAWEKFTDNLRTIF